MILSVLQKYIKLAHSKCIVIIITADMHKFMNTKGIVSVITEQP